MRHSKLMALAIAVAVLIGGSGLAARGETLVERGAYLVNGIGSCGNCHSPQEPDGTLAGAPFSGGPAITSPAFTVYPPNLTSDPETGLGRWTEAQIVTALREGGGVPMAGCCGHQCRSHCIGTCRIAMSPRSRRT